MKKFIFCGIGLVLLLMVGVLVWVYSSTLSVKDVQEEKVVCLREGRCLRKGDRIKVMTWNIQYMAGKNYVFFYDLPNDSGPDIRPSREDIQKTFGMVRNIIVEENPDVILLQELHDGAKRTDYQDQLKELLKILPKEYGYYTTAFYWKSAFVPHSRIMGAVGMKMGIISKFRIRKAIRYQLPVIPMPFYLRPFNFKRAILAAYFPVEKGEDLVILSVHLDAFAHRDGTMVKQVKKVDEVLTDLEGKKHPWIIGGDFNLIPPGKAYSLLGKEQYKFSPKSELSILYDKYLAIPSYEQVNGANLHKWFTENPNDPSRSACKTIDYFFLSKKGIKLGKYYVRRDAKTLKISDHLPVVVMVEVGK